MVPIIKSNCIGKTFPLPQPLFFDRFPKAGPLLESSPFGKAVPSFAFVLMFLPAATTAAPTAAPRYNSSGSTVLKTNTSPPRQKFGSILWLERDLCDFFCDCVCALPSSRICESIGRESSAASELHTAMFTSTIFHLQTVKTESLCIVTANPYPE